MNILNRHSVKDKLAIVCVDDYYKRYDKFPDDIRGVPTIHLEQGNNITAYEGKHAIDFIEKLLVKLTEQSNNELASSSPSPHSLSQPQPNNAEKIPDWAAAAQTLTPDKIEELKKKGAGEYDASFLRDSRFKGKGNDDSDEKRAQQAKLAELQKEYGGGNASTSPTTTNNEEGAPSSKPTFNDVMSGKTNATKGNLLK